MRLIEAPNTEDLFCRLTDERGEIEMGVSPTMFGFRVKAGFVRGGMYSLDWCGGSEQKSVETLYSLCRWILLHRVADHAFVQLPPASQIKPFLLDIEFTKTIFAAASEYGATDYIDLPSLSSIRSQYLKQFEEGKQTLLKAIWDK